MAAVKDVALRKPLVVLKCGRSQRGREAVASHTGSLAGSDKVFSGVCRQYGVIRADDSEGLYDAAKILACMRLPAGRRVLVISSSGGSCALAADAGDAQGLVLPDLPDDYVSALKRPRSGRVGLVRQPAGPGDDRRRPVPCRPSAWPTPPISPTPSC